MLYQTAVFIHILSAVVWLGGMLFLVMVLVPLYRRERRAGGDMGELLRQITQKFLPVAWSAMALLAVTGVYLAWDHWGIRPGNFFTVETHFVRILQVKTGVFLAVIALSLAHDFWLGPRVLDSLHKARSGNGSPPGRSARVLLLTFARVNLVAVLITLVLAVFLTRP